MQSNHHQHNGASEPGAPDVNGLITQTRDTDVLCGRGGAALRHPGNQTYRRLVNLNKGLYITCLKTEKLKISRSIVAAIREQNGRFLEKDSKRDAWYDIGDKKAVEKTSQALREGQPKLRQQIAEMGAAAAVVNLPTPKSAYDAVNEAALQQQQQLLHQRQEHAMMPPPIQQQQQQQQQSQIHQQQNQIHQQQMLRQQELVQQHAIEHHRRLSSQSSHSGISRRQHEMQSMEPPSPLPTSTAIRQQELHADMLQRLTIQDMDLNHHHHHQRGSITGVGNYHHVQQRSRLRPSLNARASLANELGIAESQLSLMSEFSAFGGSMSSSGRGSTGRASNASISIGSGPGVSSAVNESQGLMSVDSSFRRALMGLPLGSIRTLNSDQYSMDNTSMSTGANHTSDMHFQNSSAAAAAAAAAAVNNPNNKFDRRRVFAKMKYNRPPSVRSPTAAAHQQATGHSQFSLDEMPDFHMLESNMSLYSNLSNMTGLDTKPAASTTATGTDSMFNNNNNNNNNNHSTFPTNRVIVETAKVVDHSSQNRPNLLGEILGAGSRHSIMSGLSRISDSSIDHSIFSDLSRKIGNVSTRSMAMSEISAFDLQERENEDDSNADFDIAPAVVGVPALFEQTKPIMDFEL